MKIILTFLTTLLLFSSVLRSQETAFHPVYGHTYKVIAISGLKLRSKPSVRSEIIKKIPFGKNVRLVHKDDYGYEVLDSIITKSNSKYYAQGFWVRITDGHHEGFLNTAYLYPVYGPHFMDEKLEKGANQDYVLLVPGSNCRGNIITHYHDLKWYGIYKTEIGNDIKPISFQYLRADGQMVDMSIVVNEDKDLKYIIGTKADLVEGYLEVGLENRNFYDREAGRDTIERIIYEDDYCLVKEKGQCNKREYQGNFETRCHPLFSVYAKSKEQLQQISDVPMIDWVGDIDRDGRMDYIVTRGEVNSMTILFLSSERVGNELVRPVGIYYAGYCC